MRIRPTGSTAANRSNFLRIVAFTHQLAERVRLSRGINSLQFAGPNPHLPMPPALTASFCHPSLPPPSDIPPISAYALHTHTWHRSARYVCAQRTARGCATCAAGSDARRYQSSSDSEQRSIQRPHTRARRTVSRIATVIVKATYHPHADRRRPVDPEPSESVSAPGQKCKTTTSMINSTPADEEHLTGCTWFIHSTRRLT